MKRKPLLGKILKEIAPKIGAEVRLEPEYGYVGQIRFKNGKICYFRGSALDLNPDGSSEVAKDKAYATYFLKRLGYNVPQGKVFYSKYWCQVIGSETGIDAGYRYAKQISFPVIVKPNNKSQGSGVTKVFNRREFYRAANFVFRRSNVALIQPVISGKDYRVVVLDDKIISAYERISLEVVGDGKSTISELLEEKHRHFQKLERHTVTDPEDFRVKQNLSRMKLNVSSVLATGVRIQLLDNANLSSGGTSTDVTGVMDQKFRDICINATRDMGLRLCGVDLIIEGDISTYTKNHSILEINAAPGLDNYATGGSRQKQSVEELYTEVLQAMEKSR